MLKELIACAPLEVRQEFAINEGAFQLKEVMLVASKAS